MIYTQNDIHLDDQNPPIDIIYLKYDRAEKLFDSAAWKLIKEHGTVNFYIEKRSLVTIDTFFLIGIHYANNA